MATTLTYTVSDFIPFTKILSADVNSRFNDIKNRFNYDGTTATGLGDDNIQSNSVSGGGLTRSTKLKAGTANYVIINDASGLMREEATLASTRGGLGFSPTISTATSGKVVGVNDAGTSLELRSPEASTIVEQFAGNVATLTAGETLAANEAVCLDLIDGQYRVMKTDYSNANRLNSFIGFAMASASVTPQITTLTKVSAWTSDTINVTVNGRTYSYTFATSNDASMTALAALIATDQDVQAAAAGASPSNVITVTSKGALTMTITDSQTGSAPDFTIANTQTAVGSSIRVQMLGPLSGFTLTVGSKYYISSTGTGTITSMPPSSAIFVGQALSSSVLFINPNQFNLSFAVSQLFMRSHGRTDPGTASTASGTTETFNFSSWSTATSDSNSLGTMSLGNAGFGGNLVAVDGYVDGVGTGARTRLFNKTSWSSAGGNRATAKSASSCGSLNGFLYFGKGVTDNSASTVVTTIDSWNGSTWSSAVGSFATGNITSGCFVVNGYMSLIGGQTISSSQNTHETWNGSTNSTATVTPVSTNGWGGSSNCPTASGMSGAAYGTQDTYKWSGSSWSSSISSGVSTNEATVVNGTAVAGLQNGGNSYNNGGASSTSVAVATTLSFNGTSWSSSPPASTFARAGSAGGVA